MKLLTRPATAAPYGHQRAIVASARKLNLRDRNEMQNHSVTATQARQWQDKAWGHHDGIGEIWFAHNLVANVMSRIRIYAAYVLDADSPPVPLSDAATIERTDDNREGDGPHRPVTDLRPGDAVEIRDLFNKAFVKTNVPTMMRNFTLNASVPGECHLAMLDGAWQIKSTAELYVDASGVPKLNTVRGGAPKDLPKSTQIGRIWREHPRFSFEPDSAMRALSDDCEELLLLNRVIRTNGRARLHAGLLYVPDEVSIANATVTDDQEIEEDEEAAFEKEFMETVQAAIADEDNLATVFPTLLRGPAELAKSVIHIKLERVIDEFLVARADRTLERILQGLDVPKDIVTGLANVKYSNAVQIDESLYKAHVEPLAVMICDAITDIVLRPLIKAKFADASFDPDKVVVWYDPSEVITRPDRSGDAKTLYDAHELSGAALRAAHGFSETDKPSQEELAKRLAMANTPPPEVLMILLQELLPSVLKSLGASSGGEGELPAELQQTLAGTEVPGEPEPLEPTVPGEV